MNRVEAIRAYSGKILSALPPEKRQAAVLHTYGVAECCALLALRRGLDAEIAFISGLLHDLYAYSAGSYLCHAQSGAEMARPFLRDSGLFSEEEQTAILSAVYRHASKELVNGPYDEVLKDADTLEPFLSGAAQAASPPSRLPALLAELRIPHAFSPAPPAVPGKTAAFDRSAFAALAEQLAAKTIRGEKGNRDFAEIIRYFPEASAFDELTNAWCAAFLYHCALQSGLHLPLRQPPASCRFACVAAWLQWGEANGFRRDDRDGFDPQRGDIVIYRNIIPFEYRQPNSLWCDHIGIVVACDGDRLAVAEGNVDNRNESGVVSRTRGDRIGCYLRIPDGYTYDGWKFDYQLP